MQYPLADVHSPLPIVRGERGGGGGEEGGGDSPPHCRNNQEQACSSPGGYRVFLIEKTNPLKSFVEHHSIVYVTDRV